MNEEEALYLNQLTTISDIPASLQHFHNEYEQAKAKLSVVAQDTAQVHRNLRVKLQKDIREARKYIRLGENLVEDVESTHVPPTEELLGKVAAIDEFGKIAKYLDWIKFLNEAVKFLEKRQNHETWRRCLPVYDQLNCYSSLMEDTACANLKRVMVAECKKRYAFLTDTAIKSFGTVNWKTLTPESVAAVLENLKFLFKLSEPLHHGEPNIKLGLEYLFGSFRLQFKFHFMRKVKTNDIKKPEWYLTKLLSWIKENKDSFLDHFGGAFQAEVGEAGNISALYVEQFCELAVLKLKDDVPKLSDSLFTHYVDEVLKFHKELGDVVTLSHITSPILRLFTEDRTLKRWLQLETISSFEFLSNIWKDENCYELRDSGYSYKIPAMCIRVLTLVKSVGERVKVVPSMALNNCFYSLQCDILREFMVHMSDTLQNLDHKAEQFHLIINSVIYVLAIVEEWSYDKHYIKISKFEEDISPFFDISRSYALLLQDAQDSLQSGVTTKVSSLLGGYYKQSWMLPRKLDTISPACSAGLMELQQSVVTLNTALEGDTFLEVWSSVASSFQQSFLSKILFKSQFNLAGAQQFRADMQAFCGIFHEYCSPLYFAKFNEHCVVLAQPCETVRLWRGEGTRNPDNLQELLQEQAIVLEINDVLKILKLRADV